MDSEALEVQRTDVPFGMGAVSWSPCRFCSRVETGGFGHGD